MRPGAHVLLGEEWWEAKMQYLYIALFDSSFTGWVPGSWADMLEKQGVGSVGRAAALQTGETEARQRG